MKKNPQFIPTHSFYKKRKIAWLKMFWKRHWQIENIQPRQPRQILIHFCSLLVYKCRISQVKQILRLILLFTGNFMCTFWSGFRVLTATMTKPNIRRKTNPNVLYPKAFLQISYQERLRLRSTVFSWSPSIIDCLQSDSFSSTSELVLGNSETST